MITDAINNVQFPTWDTELFLFLNGLHTPWLDPIMKAFSAELFWVPLYLAIIFFMIRKKVWTGVIAILFLGLSFAITDQSSVLLFKNVFMRLRPCHDPTIQHLVYQLEHCGGQYGFISNHASNTFTLAVFTSLFFKTRWYTISIFVWASIVAYSRIYVGKHFPLDIICGAAFGMLVGWFIFELYNLLSAKIYRNK